MNAASALEPMKAETSENGSDNLLIEAVKAYQASLDAGETPDRAAFLDRFPEVAAELSDCLDNLDFLRNVAPQLNACGADDPTQHATSIAPNTAPPQLGDFRILREIGRGGMGVVYEAEQISMSRHVALKVLPFAAVLDQKALQRFRSEAQVAGQLVHQNIVPVYSVGCERSVHYYAMQYIEGRTLAELIVELREEAAGQGTGGRGHGAGSESLVPTASFTADTSPVAALSTAKSNHDSSYIRSAVKLFIQAADALDYAHAEGVIHRDIKPSNLMLDGRGKIFVTDFGLAHVETGPSVTITGDFLGTLRYMSPEQALAQRVVVDHRTDIYSLGLTFYELLTLRAAFTGENRQELLRQVTFEEPPRPRRLNRAIPADLETILLKTIEKNPADRYASAGELANDLSRYVEDRPIQANRPTTVQRTRKWCRRHRSLVTTCIASAVALLAFVAVGSSVLAVRLREVAEQEKAAVQRQLKDKDRIAALLAISYNDQGHLLCAKGEVAAGMLWMAQALHIAPEDAVEVRRVIRQNLAAWSTQLHRLEAVFRHDRPVTAVTHCSAASRVFTGHEDGSAQLWDQATGQPAGPQIRLDSKVSAAAYHAGKNVVAAGTSHGMVTLIDASTGAIAGEPFDFDSEVHALAFSRDTPQLLVRTYSTAILVDLTNGETVGRAKVPNWSVAAVAFGPDGAPLALMESVETYQLWDLAVGKFVGVPGKKRGRNDATIAPDGKHFAAGGGDNWLWYWDARTGEKVFPDKQHGSDIHAVTVSPEGRKLATAGLNSAIRIRDAATGEQIGHALDHTAPITTPAIQFGPGGRSMVVGAGDGATRLWELALDRPPAFPHTYQASSGNAPSAVTAAAFAPNGRRIAVSVGADSHAEIWDLDVPASDGPVLIFGRRIGKKEFTSDGMSIVTVTWDGLIEVRNADSGTIVGSPIQAGQGIRDVKLSPDSSRIVTAHQVGYHDGYAQVWDVETGRAIGSPLRHEGTVTCVDVSRDGQKIATGSYYGIVQVWDAETLLPLGEPLMHENHITDVAFSPDGTRLAAATAGRTGHVWDLETRSRIGQPLQHTVGLRAIAYSPDPDRPRVLTGALDNTAQFWDADTGKPIGPPLTHESGVWEADFSLDGSKVFVAGDGTVRIWPVPLPAVEGVLERIDLWVELITGMELDINAGGAVKTISAPDWLTRRNRLVQLGGPPLE